MAKRRTYRRSRRSYRASSVRRSSGFSFRKKRSRKSSSNSVSNKALVGTLVGAGIYGAVREKASNALMPVTSKLPFGALADEVTLGIVGYAMAKGKIPLVNKIPMSRDIGKAALTIEAARAGSYLASSFMPGNTMSSSIYN